MKTLSYLVCLAVLLLSILSGCASQPEFNGNRTSNDTQFIMDYTVLNRTETHEMDLEAGTVIDVEIENNSGRLDVLVTHADGNELYRGDDADSMQFSLPIPEAGVYLFSVTGTNAKGRVSFIVAEE